MRAYIYAVYVGRKMLKTFCVNVHLSLQCGGLFGMRVVASGVLFSQHPSSLRGASETLLRRCFTCSPHSLAKRTLTSPLVGRPHFLVSLGTHAQMMLWGVCYTGIPVANLLEQCTDDEPMFLEPLFWLLHRAQEDVSLAALSPADMRQVRWRYQASAGRLASKREGS